MKARAEKAEAMLFEAEAERNALLRSPHPLRLSEAEAMLARLADPDEKLLHAVSIRGFVLDDRAARRVLAAVAVELGVNEREDA